MELKNEYDIEKAFKVIEDKLISSMIRNFADHRAEELEEGYQWGAWQVYQLNSLEEYKRANKEAFKSEFSNINKAIDVMITHAREQGGADQEIKILQAIKQGANLDKLSDKASAKFFKVNDRKLKELRKATVGEIRKAETSLLRKANDVYRKVIYNAQVYANTGAGTYEQAVDMATKDMLKAGIKCVQYSNGAMHTIDDYAKMAVQTANKRAYLAGEGEMRKSWNTSTVILKYRANACPKCLPFVGKIFIDDVWSGGKASDGNYPLLSSAIEAGLYHPNCKDIHTTYFPELDSKEKIPKSHIQTATRKYSSEQRIAYEKRQYEAYNRLEKYSLDKDNKDKYKKLRDKWKR